MASYNQIITAFTSIIDGIELQHSPVQLLNDLLHENHHSPNLPTLLRAIDAANDQECRSFLSELNSDDPMLQDKSVNKHLKTVITNRIHEEITTQLNNLVSAVLDAASINADPKNLLLYKLISEPSNTLSTLLPAETRDKCKALLQQSQINPSYIEQALHAIQGSIPDTDNLSPLDTLLRSLLANQDGLNNDKSVTLTKEYKIADQLSSEQRTSETYKEQFSEAFKSEIDKNIESLIAKIYNESRNPSTSEFTERKNSSSQNRTDSKIFNIDFKEELMVEKSTHNVVENRENTGSESKSPSTGDDRDILSEESLNQVEPQQKNLTTVFDWVQGPNVRKKAENLAEKENNQEQQRQQKLKKNQPVTSKLSNNQRPYNSKKSLPKVTHKDPLILSSVIVDNNQKDDLKPSSSHLSDSHQASSSALSVSSAKESKLEPFDFIPKIGEPVKIDDEADLTNSRNNLILSEITEQSMNSEKKSDLEKNKKSGNP